MFGKSQKFTGQLQMTSLSLCPQFETNLISNRIVIELLLQLKSAKDHGKNYIKVKPLLVSHLLRNRLFLRRDLEPGHNRTLKLVTFTHILD